MRSLIFLLLLIKPVYLFPQLPAGNGGVVVCNMVHYSLKFNGTVIVYAKEANTGHNIMLRIAIANKHTPEPIARLWSFAKKEFLYFRISRHWVHFGNYRFSYIGIGKNKKIYKVEKLTCE